MAQQLHRIVTKENPPLFDMRALRRLAIWGTGAAAALSVAVLAGYASPAAQRLLGATSAANGQTQRRADASPAQTTTRGADADHETQRLVEAVRALAADRNELLKRLGAIEQSLEDITGSINRQTITPSPTPPPKWPAIDASALFSAPLTPPATLEMASPLLPPPGPVVTVPQQQSPTPNQIAALPAIGGSPGTELLKPKIETKIEAKIEAKAEVAPEFGADIGGAVNFEALRVLWNSTKAGHGAQLEGLSPLVAVRENNKSRATELRLIVGPLADAEAATRLCAALAAARRSCQPAPFVGEHFALTSPQPERKPLPAAERKPAAAAPAAAPATAPARQPARATP